MLGTLTVIPPLGLEDAKAAVVNAFNRAFSRPTPTAALTPDSAATA
jgi:hypothetical protein